MVTSYSAPVPLEARSSGGSSGSVGSSHSEGRSTQPSQERQPTPSSDQKKKGKGPRLGPIPLDETDVIVRTTNFSFAPGPVWLEAITMVAINVAQANPLTIDIPLYGGGQLLMQGLADPIVCCILPPQGPPFDQEPRFGDEAHVPHPPDFHWWPKYSWSKISDFVAATPSEPPEELQADYKKKLEAQEKKAKEAMAKADAEKHQEQKSESEKPRMQGRLVTPPGDIDQWLLRTGMSAKGFPGFPRSINRTMQKAGIPPTAGISYIDAWFSPDDDDWDIDVYMVGTGTIPVGSRWLFMTMRGQ